MVMPSKAVSAGVSANPHHFPSSLANQNGVSSHVTSSQPQDSPTTSVLANEQAQSSCQQSQSLANTKEKTPMCLINELARFNRVRILSTVTLMTIFSQVWFQIVILFLLKCSILFQIFNFCACDRIFFSILKLISVHGCILLALSDINTTEDSLSISEMKLNQLN